MKIRLKITSIFLALAFLLPLAALRAQREPIQGLNDYILKSMKEWETPGLAIAMVRNDSVIFAKGYGVRKMGEEAPVTPRTIFAIASTTKAMTVACLGMLVDEKELAWDDPVTKHLPWFQLYDPYVTRDLMVRDLLTHRSGLSRGDMLWYLSPYSRDEVLHRIRFLKPSWGFRSRYGYQNIMFIAAGQMIPAITDTSWDDFIKERLFAPLGMTRSSTSITALQGMDDVATPHTRIDSTMQPIRWPNFDNVGPAGSVNSCVLDMAQWVRMNLNDGVYEGKRLLSPEVIREIQTPQTVIRRDSLDRALWPSNHFAAYGFGWSLRDFLGRKLIQHDGALDGMRARVVLVPEEKLGFVILFNSSNTNLHASIAYWILDRELGGPVRDWSAELLKGAKEGQQKEDAQEKKREAERAKGTHPSLPLDKYVGTYENVMYGQLKVLMENGNLVLDFNPSYIGDMKHWQYDTFQVDWHDKSLGKDFVTFTLDVDGNVDELRWEGLAVFKRGK
jgi:CubicO group peptidase (beta-lactamase class C family)